MGHVDFERQRNLKATRDKSAPYYDFEPPGCDNEPAGLSLFLLVPSFQAPPQDIPNNKSQFLKASPSKSQPVTNEKRISIQLCGLDLPNFAIHSSLKSYVSHGNPTCWMEATRHEACQWTFINQALPTPRMKPTSLGLRIWWRLMRCVCNCHMWPRPFLQRALCVKPKSTNECLERASLLHLQVKYYRF